ncbi:MAG TPA: hypothetical protein VFW87_05120 [Pirellulales bacterium]|nr:hypothetical protein [Pirellulales bacterium]
MKKSTSPPAPESETLTTQTALAKAFDVSPNTVKKWLLRAGFPGGAKGPWSYDRVADYLRTTGSPKAPAGEAAAPSDVDASKAIVKGTATAKLLAAREQARRLKLENDRREGLLVRREEAARVMAQHVAEVKTHLAQLPDKVAAAVRLPPAQKKKLREKIAGWVRGYCSQFEASLRALAKVGAAPRPTPKE